jgi:N-glycosylase/DNA lyase
MITPLPLHLPPRFHFEHTIYSHGWCALFPFRLSTEALSLRYTLPGTGGKTDTLIFSAAGRARATVSVEHRAALSAKRQEHAASAAASILHCDLDLRPFYARVREDRDFSWIARHNTGRMLRGATFFEDVVKMILTTNCSWSLTTQMNTRLLQHFGIGGDDPASAAFPVPAAIADSSEHFLRREVKLGYRAPFILELARRCASGTLDIEEFRRSRQPSAELYRELRSIKGVGEYAASGLLKLLGRYDRLGLDSWCRAKFADIHNGGASVSDEAIEAYYAPFEEWKGLVMWMDVTRDWYAEKFPF